MGDENSQTPMAIVVCVGDMHGYKCMYVGKKYAGATFTDYLENSNEKIVIDSNGNGNFVCQSRNVSVWVLEKNINYFVCLSGKFC
jgi:alpha-amylase